MSMLRKPLSCIEVGTEDLDEMEKALTKATDQSKQGQSTHEIENVDAKTVTNQDTPIIAAGPSMVTSTPLNAIDFASPSISAAPLPIGLANTQITPIGIAVPSDSSQVSSSFRTPHVRPFPGAGNSS